MSRRLLSPLFFTLGLCLVLTNLPGCKSSEPLVNVASAAPDVAKNIGTVQKVFPDGKRGPIFVFEEVHTSRIGQLQIAAMLVRLHDHYGVKNIALEGSIWSGRSMAPGWYQNAAGGGAEERDMKEDLAVRMVADGEISSAEMMSLLFSDVHVYGVEDQTQYSQELNAKGSGAFGYLLAIAEAGLTQDDIQKLNALINDTSKPKEKRQEEALDYMLNANPWVHEQYENLKKSAIVSSEQEVSQLRAIQAKATEVGAKISSDVQEDMQAEIRFMETASERSTTMVTNTLRLPDTQQNTPEVLIIGAAHADKVIQLLQQQNVAYSLIQPLNLDSSAGSMSTAEYNRKVKGQWAVDLPGSLGYVLNHNRKPPPVIERSTGKSYASMQLATIIMARGVRSGGSFPNNVWDQLSALPGVRVDRDSISRDGNDVIFRAWLTQDDGREKEVWARVGTVRAAKQGPRTLETKLVETSEQMATGGGDGGKNHDGGKKGGGDGDEPPAGKRGHAGEGPGDRDQNGVHLSRTSMDTMVAFASTHDEIMRTPHISD